MINLVSAAEVKGLKTWILNQTGSRQAELFPEQTDVKVFITIRQKVNAQNFHLQLL